MTTLELMTDLQNKIENLLSKFPYFRVHISTLGGEVNSSVLVTIGLDKRETWNHGIFENSRYVRFHIDRHPKGVELECFQFHVKNKEMKKFRTFRGTPEKMMVTFEKYVKVLEDIV